jgi:hypothetical protein
MGVVEEGIDLGLSTSDRLVQVERMNVGCTCRPKIAVACLPSKRSGNTVYHSSSAADKSFTYSILRCARGMFCGFRVVGKVGQFRS